MIERLWYVRGLFPHPLLWPLLPLSWLYFLIVVLRRRRYLSGSVESYRPAVPVVMVGNLTVGGTGKTPLVIWLAEYLKKQGMKPGVVSRGYGGSAQDWPRLVSAASNPAEVGDEPVLIARRTRIPVVCDPQRARAVQRILQYGVNIIIADDGLQHYALQRDLEIVVIDSGRGFGNGQCLPAGPLREPASRAAHANLLVFNGERRRLPGTEDLPSAEMLLEGGILRCLGGGREESLGDWRGKRVHAVAGIGNPQRFFDSLRRMGMDPIPHAFPDHHKYAESDLRFKEDLPVVMTEKDAVKCADFQNPLHWYLPVTARFEPASANLLDNAVKGMLRGFKAA